MGLCSLACVHISPIGSTPIPTSSCGCSKVLVVLNWALFRRTQVHAPPAQNPPCALTEKKTCGRINSIERGWTHWHVRMKPLEGAYLARVRINSDDFHLEVDQCQGSCSAHTGACTILNEPL